jgi:hypothetical protein
MGETLALLAKNGYTREIISSIIQSHVYKYTIFDNLTMKIQPTRPETKTAKI